jgi:hypothetical protein
VNGMTAPDPSDVTPVAKPHSLKKPSKTSYKIPPPPKTPAKVAPRRSKRDQVSASSMENPEAASSSVSYKKPTAIRATSKLPAKASAQPDDLLQQLHIAKDIHEKRKARMSSQLRSDSPKALLQKLRQTSLSFDQASRSKSTSPLSSHDDRGEATSVGNADAEAQLLEESAQKSEQARRARGEKEVEAEGGSTQSHGPLLSLRDS